MPEWKLLQCITDKGVAPGLFSKHALFGWCPLRDTVVLLVPGTCNLSKGVSMSSAIKLAWVSRLLTEACNTKAHIKHHLSQQITHIKLVGHARKMQLFHHYTLMFYCTTGKMDLLLLFRGISSTPATFKILPALQQCTRDILSAPKKLLRSLLTISNQRKLDWASMFWWSHVLWISHYSSSANLRMAMLHNRRHF